MRPDSHVQGRAHCGVCRGSLGRAVGTTRSCTRRGDGSNWKPLWSRVSGPTGAIVMSLRRLGWTWPRHTTFVTASGLEVDLRETRTTDGKTQASLARWKEWADNDERKELLPRPPNGTSGLGEQARPPLPTRSARDQSGAWRDPGRMVDARGGEQGRDHPNTRFCLKCEPAVLGSPKHQLWGLPSLPWDTIGSSSDSSASRERGLVCDPVEKHTPGRTHDGTLLVWVHHSVVGNSFGGIWFCRRILDVQTWSAGWTSWMGSGMKALGMRVSHARILGIDPYGLGAARQRRTQNGRLTKVKKRMPKVSVLPEVRCGHEQDRHGGVHAERVVRREVHGHAAIKGEVLQDNDWTVPARQTRGTVAHLAARCASVRSDTPMQSRANRSVGRGSVGRAAGRCRST